MTRTDTAISLEQRVQYLTDRIEIQDVILRCRLGQDLHENGDNNVLDQWNDVFAPNATADYSSTSAPLDGVGFPRTGRRHARPERVNEQATQLAALRRAPPPHIGDLLDGRLLHRQLSTGTDSPEHGIGPLKRRWLAGELGTEGVSLQIKIESVFHPNDILNPGEAI